QESLFILEFDSRLCILIDGINIARVQKEYMIDKESLKLLQKKDKKMKISRAEYKYSYIPSSSEMKKLSLLVTYLADSDIEEIIVIRDIP
ncbi:14077_t:CDS:2, partial [Gigaspora rosea]